MSDFTAVRAVTETLRQLLKAHITDSTDPEISGVVIDLRSPKEMRADSESLGVSLWLYQVVRNGDLQNHPPPRVGLDQIRRHPIPVNLHYLVTPIAKKPSVEQALLGRILQVFNDYAIVEGALLKDSLEGGEEALRLNLEPLALEELTRVWDALKEPYQLSLAYDVQTVSIDSDREPEHVPAVTTRHQDLDAIASVT